MPFSRRSTSSVRVLTGNQNLTKTFTLNSLVSLDLALWTLFFRENQLSTFDDLIPPEYRPALAVHQQKLARVPVISYNTSREELLHLVDSGHFFLKIKLGQAGTAAEMLEKDRTRLKEIHEALAGRQTPHTRGGKIQYYLDANGRYPDKETLQRLIDFLDRMKILEQVALLEEPFPPEVRADVSDLPVCLAADESLHDISEVNERADLGYKAMAIKPAGKDPEQIPADGSGRSRAGDSLLCRRLRVHSPAAGVEQERSGPLKAVPGIGDGDHRIPRGADL